MMKILSAAALVAVLAAPAIAQDAKTATPPATTPAAKAVEAPKAQPATTNAAQPAAKPAEVVTKPADGKDTKKVDAKDAAKADPKAGGPAVVANPGTPPKTEVGAAGKGETTKTTEKPAETKKQ